jgi:hypothetical protein
MRSLSRNKLAERKALKVILRSTRTNKTEKTHFKRIAQHTEVGQIVEAAIPLFQKADLFISSKRFERSHIPGP